MILYVRQLAWLQAVPESKNIAKGQERITRAKQMEDNPMPLPKVDGCNYLIDYLFEVGPVSTNGMGIGAVSFSEMDAWQSLCGHDLTPWEAITLKSMSAAYVQEAHKAESPTAPPPWIEVPDEEKRERMAKHVRSVLRG